MENETIFVQATRAYYNPRVYLVAGNPSLTFIPLFSSPWQNGLSFAPSRWPNYRSGWEHKGGGARERERETFCPKSSREPCGTLLQSLFSSSICVCLCIYIYVRIHDKLTVIVFCDKISDSHFPGFDNIFPKYSSLKVKYSISKNKPCILIKHSFNFNSIL